MRSAVYNSLIPNMASRALVPASGWKPVSSISVFLLIFLATITTHATDWSSPEQQLTRKIVALTGASAVGLTIENHSSLSRRDNDIISGGLRAALQTAGLRFVNLDQAAATIHITLSENSQSYVWVAQIRRGSAETVAIVSAPRESNPVAATHDTTPMSLRKIPLWTQANRILDVAVLEENPAPTRIAVLDAEKISLYRMQSGKWQVEQELEVKHSHPWPRDLRGRMVPAKDHLLDAYLPGMICHASGSPLVLGCREGDDPWPLFANATSSTGPFQANAYFSSNRNFFTGALVPQIGNSTAAPKFFSAAFLPHEKSAVWFFAVTDSSIHKMDGTNDQPTKLAWGSNLTTVKTACGAGWQILATPPTDSNTNSARAFELPAEDAVPVSAAVGFDGEITALWTEAKGDSAIAVIQKQGTNIYEAFRLAIDCSQ
jgi:hypothetical protein